MAYQRELRNRKIEEIEEEESQVIQEVEEKSKTFEKRQDNENLNYNAIMQMLEMINKNMHENNKKMDEFKYDLNKKMDETKTELENISIRLEGKMEIHKEELNERIDGVENSMFERFNIQEKKIGEIEKDIIKIADEHEEKFLHLDERLERTEKFARNREQKEQDLTYKLKMEIQQDIKGIEEKHDRTSNALLQEIRTKNVISPNINWNTDNTLKFNGNIKQLHPRIFLKELKNKLRLFTDWENQKEIIRAQLISSALLWFLSKEEEIRDLNEFETKFINYFWGDIQQGNFRQELMWGKFNYMEEVGYPKKCILDNATYFRNDRFNTYCIRNNMVLNYISIRHPQANPAERYIQEVMKFLRLLVQEQHNTWDLALEKVEYYLNNIPNVTTEETPIYLMKNKKPERHWETTNVRNYDRVIEEVRKRLKRSGEKYLRRMDKKKKRNQVKFKKGDLVILRAYRVSDKRKKICAKLKTPFEGPYIIENEQGLNSYRLKGIDTDRSRGIFHINDIYEFKRKTN